MLEASYRHPGKLFVERFGLPKSREDVYQYAGFLRAEAGLDPEAPLDLAHIRKHFGIPTPKLRALPSQQGLLLNPEAGIIVIHQDDPATRQRFTEGHELMELLFAAEDPNSGWAARTAGGFRQETKERLCNEGAAELLMPRSAILGLLLQHGISFATARLIAMKYFVSLTASLVQMTRVGPGRHALVVWQMKHKPTELRTQAPVDQMSLFGEAFRDLPPRKLRVVWSMGGPNTPFIPPDKSAPQGSAMIEAWQTGTSIERAEMLDLGNVRGMIRSENLPFDQEADRQVISLLHLPGDTDCP